MQEFFRQDLRLMTAPDAQSPAEDRAFGKALRFQFGLGVDLFIDARHRDENGRPHFLQRLRQILDEWTVSECYAVVEHREIHMARGNVAQRQERNTINPGRMSNPSREHWMFEAMLPWVSIAPLEVPVVPEVYTMVARSSGAVERARASISIPSVVGPSFVICRMFTHLSANGARSPLNSRESMVTIFSICVCGRIETTLCNCWSRRER